MQGFQGLGTFVFLAGVFLIGFGLWVTYGLPALGNLPGDLVWRGERVTVVFPLATSLILSLILTGILNFLGRR